MVKFYKKIHFIEWIDIKTANKHPKHDSVNCSHFSKILKNSNFRGPFQAFRMRFSSKNMLHVLKGPNWSHLKPQNLSRTYLTKIPSTFRANFDLNSPQIPKNGFFLFSKKSQQKSSMVTIAYHEHGCKWLRTNTQIYKQRLSHWMRLGLKPNLIMFFYVNKSSWQVTPDS